MGLGGAASRFVRAGCRATFYRRLERRRLRRPTRGRKRSGGVSRLDTSVVLQLPGLDCPECARHIRVLLKGCAGVSSVETDFASGLVTAAGSFRAGELIKALGRHGYTAQVLERARGDTLLSVAGLGGPDDGRRLEQALLQRPGVTEVSVWLETGRARVVHTGPVADLLTAARSLGYPATLEWEEEQAPAGGPGLQVYLTGICGLALALAFLFGLHPLSRPLSLLAVAAGGYLPLRSAVVAVRSRLGLDINVLLLVAVAGAISLGELAEAGLVVFLFSAGHLLESYTLARTRRTLQALLELRPRHALVRRGLTELRLPVDEICTGDVVIVRPGERFPVDGRVVAGTGHVDESTITGEAMPVYKEAGAALYSGTINVEAALEVAASRRAQDSTLARIIHLVETAQASRAPAQRAIDRFARYYTPAVIAGAVMLAVIPPLVGGLPFGPWVYRALVLLLVSCPCALVISTPVAVVAAIGSAARRGVLIKGGAPLETAGRVRAVAFDKTGTLTWGRPSLTGYLAVGGSDETLLEVLAAVESRSTHPLARAALEAAAARGLQVRAVDHFVAVPGRGARGELDGQAVYVGSPRYLGGELGIDLSPLGDRLAYEQGQGRTVVLVGREGKLLGMAAFSDQLRPDCGRMLEKLRRQGVSHLVMLTGDGEAAASRVAGHLGLEYRAELLPEDKVQLVQELVARYGQVAMVGDGVNDAPALAAASIGLAMAGAGADVAMETADIALLGDNLMRVPYVLELGRETRRVMRQNIAASLVTKAVALTLVSPGWLTLWLAVLADTGVAMAVTLNAMRLMRVKVDLQQEVAKGGSLGRAGRLDAGVQLHGDTHRCGRVH